MVNKSDSLDDKISSGFANQYDDQLEHEKTRKKIICIFQEQIATVNFAETIKKYAAEEMDRRVFRSIKYWVVVVVSAIITATIGYLFGKLLR